jgi:enterochelin esterase family protein
VTILDPSNTFSKPMRSGTTSVLSVPGEQPAPVERVPGVARGAIHLRDYESKALGRSRRLRVYTPAAYEKSSARFPVLYLLHGSGDNEATWTELGRAHVILDNLIATRKAVPMIVVMTDGHAFLGNEPEGRAKNIAAFERDLLEDVMPLVETHYRTVNTPDKRAIAGLSMGGGQAVAIGLKHLERFAWIGGMSSSVREPEHNFAAFLANPVTDAKRLRLLWLAIGKDDFLLKENRLFNQLLAERRVPHEYIETQGNHSWPVWRRYLAELAPRLFVGGK